MKTRGEKQYINMPSFAARLYDNLTSVKGVNKGFEDIAQYFDSFIKQGKLLDVGTGPGRLLFEINKRIPELELFGIDISESMLNIAKQNLKKIKNVDLRVGNITKTDYPSDYFDCIVSTGSFYNWDKPIDGLNEIYRILKPGKEAFIFESTRDYNKEHFDMNLKINLKGYNPVRRIISKFFLQKQLRMTYTLDEFQNLLKQSDFKNSFKIENVELGNLPIYVRIDLKKQS